MHHDSFQHPSDSSTTHVSVDEMIQETERCKENGTPSRKTGISKTVTFESTLPRNKTKQPFASASKNHKYYSAAGMLNFSGNYAEYEDTILERVVDDVVIEFDVDDTDTTDYHAELLKLCGWSDADTFDPNYDFSDDEFENSTPSMSSLPHASTWTTTFVNRRSSLSLSSLRINSSIMSKRKANPEPDVIPSKRVSLSPLPNSNGIMDDNLDFALTFPGDNLDSAVAQPPQPPTNRFNEGRRVSSDFWKDINKIEF